ncbi:MAG: hypothetical protein QNI89_17690 [Desulfobacterales bacterium]|nr:hypothetical protein [Desulfobacterales bacterium]
MPQTRYDVILTDQIAADRDLQEVTAALARLLGQDAHRVAALIKKGDQVLKRHVDASTGRQYLRALNAAGAVGRLRPTASPSRPVSSDGRRHASAAASDLAVRVISPRAHPADVAFAPIQANRITHAEGGIDVNRIDTPPIPYGAIALLAVYEDPEDEKKYLLVFIKDQKRAYRCDANRIVFSDFPGTQATSVIASLRLFLEWIASRHAALRVDPSTAGFIEGRPPAILEIDPVRYTTMLGKALSAMAADPVA